MGITYRQSHEGRLSIEEMDNNFHYIEEQLAGLTSSNPDRLISTNDLEVVLDTKGTLNTPLLIPTSFTAVCDTDHMIDTYEFNDNNWWQFEVSFQVNPDGVVETQINNPFPIQTNPGYVSTNSFRFTEADHGIPDFIFDISLNDVYFPGDAGWTANLAVTEAPEYSSTIKSLGAVKITANDKNLTFGTDGSLTFPDNSVQTTAYTGIPTFDQVLQTGSTTSQSFYQSIDLGVVTVNTGVFGSASSNTNPTTIGIQYLEDGVPKITSGFSVSEVPIIRFSADVPGLQKELNFKLPFEKENPSYPGSNLYTLATTDDLPKIFKGVFNQTGDQDPDVQEYYNNTGYEFTNWSRVQTGIYSLSVTRNGASFSYINVGQNYLNTELSKTTSWTFYNYKTGYQEYSIYTYVDGVLSDSVAYNMFIEIGLK